MKRAIALLLAALLAYVFCACDGGISEVSDNKDNESSAAVSGTEGTIEVSADVSDESAVAADELGNVTFSVASGGSVLYVVDDGEKGASLWIRFADGELFKICDSDHLKCVKPSPNGKTVLYNEYAFGKAAKVYLFDIETRESRELSFDELREGRLPYSVEWVDDNNFVFTDVSEKGTANAGGNLYKYTLDAKYSLIDHVFLTPPDRRLQIADVTRCGKDFVLTAYYFDDGFTSHELLYYVVPESRILKERTILLPQDATGTDGYLHYAAMPSVEERANLDYVSSVEGGRELDYGTLIKMTKDEIASEIFEPANRVYREFDGLGGDLLGYYETLLFYTYDEKGKLVRDAADIVGPYGEITEYSDFVAETRKYFSKDLSKKLFENGNFFEHLGMFMYFDGVRGSHIQYRSHEYSIQSHTEGKITYKCTVRYTKDEFSDLTDEELKEEHCFYEDFLCELILEDGKWVFDSFRLPY